MPTRPRWNCCRPVARPESLRVLRAGNSDWRAVIRRLRADSCFRPIKPSKTRPGDADPTTQSAPATWTFQDRTTEPSWCRHPDSSPLSCKGFRAVWGISAKWPPCDPGGVATQKSAAPGGRRHQSQPGCAISLRLPGTQMQIVFYAVIGLNWIEATHHVGTVPVSIRSKRALPKSPAGTAGSLSATERHPALPGRLWMAGSTSLCG